MIPRCTARVARPRNTAAAFPCCLLCVGPPPELLHALAFRIPRRGHTRRILHYPSVWACISIVLLALLIQRPTRTATRFKALLLSSRHGQRDRPTTVHPRGRVTCRCLNIPTNR